MTDVTLVLCTAPEAEARSLADRLLQERLVACVNLIGPVVSRYSWQGAIEESRESVLLMKTRADLLATLMERIDMLHSYDVPEVLAFPVAGCLPAYLAWVAQTCRAAD